jgi:hypothetical protein
MCGKQFVAKRGKKQEGKRKHKDTRLERRTEKRSSDTLSERGKLKRIERENKHSTGYCFQLNLKNIFSFVKFMRYSSIFCLMLKVK